MTTTTAVPTVQFTEEEFNTIFGEISWELDILGDERRGGNEESAKDEEYLEEFAERVGCIEANKDGLYEVSKAIKCRLDKALIVSKTIDKMNKLEDIINDNIQYG